MARKKINGYESLYSGARWQRFYPDVYTRTTKGTWQTRQGRRNYEFSTFNNLLGRGFSVSEEREVYGREATDSARPGHLSQRC